MLMDTTVNVYVKGDCKCSTKDILEMVQTDSILNWFSSFVFPPRYAAVELTICHENGSNKSGTHICTSAV